ncbi:YciI family protein [Agrococcus jejuensis]|uniref:YCII-related domain-containing protein n=1 Tax=Agrococcus jejuensis TaxID=399736 RepID=A0A1G8D9P7_9MICO|nr:YciI family protein [Agrococcus jejuensis]SDH54000.1 hypothetical protein SAMN04489720_1556 [Agrococcus jejuensis]
MIALHLRYTDAPGRLELRPRHRELLDELVTEGVLLAAGPYEHGEGALLLFSADRERVQQAIDADPYMTHPGVVITAIEEWNPAIGGVRPL